MFALPVQTGHQLGHSLPFAKCLACVRLNEMQTITRQAMYGNVAAVCVCGFRIEALDHQASVRAAEIEWRHKGQ